MSNPGNRGGVMYDCIKLEAGNLVTSTNNKLKNNSGNITVSCYPNPVKDFVTFDLNLAQSEHINLKLVNLNGEEIASLFDGAAPAGRQSFNWQPANPPKGLYYYVLKTDHGVLSGKVILTGYK